jgi:hypothetical protein
VISGALLLVMFVLAWYGVVRDGTARPRAGTLGAEDAWHALTVVRWAMPLAAIVAIGSALLNAAQRSHGARTTPAGW